MITVNNMPEYAKDYKWIVVTQTEREFWFYGAYNELKEAARIAREIDGVALPNQELR